MSNNGQLSEKSNHGDSTDGRNTDRVGETRQQVTHNSPLSRRGKKEKTKVEESKQTEVTLTQG